MKIERKIVDKLGLKLYDKVSAVVAEIIANSYDADAENVLVKLPLDKALAVRRGKNIDEKGHILEVIDDGHGMTPEEADSFYLRVGKDRREDEKQGNLSRVKKRPVMGRKGIGKLAPFGVCRTIEIRSAGGTKTPKGYLVSHFELDYDAILEETPKDDSYHPRTLDDDSTFDSKPGTVIRLKNFLPRVVPDKETFARQLTYRFLPLPDFTISIEDTKSESPEPVFELEPQDIQISNQTKVVVDDRPIIGSNGETLKVSGWIGMAKQSYKNVEFAGVRIYARGKIAAITRDFGSPAGFTGEYVARSYLVGELHAEWLDEEEDLIQTHRQDILWSTELGQAFSKWGQEILKEVARKGREPRRENVREGFLRVSRLKEISKGRFNDPEIETAALELGEKIGGFASEDELNDEDYVNGLREIILTVAPHKLLVDTFRKIEQMAVDGKIDLKELLKLFNTSRIAQLASFGQIAEEKIKAIDLLDELIKKDEANECEFQKILEDAPWLIDPKWIPLTANQTLMTFRNAFQDWYKKEYSEELITTTEIDHETKRPDFILLNLENYLVVIEIKPPKHVFGDKDYTRLERYYDALDEYLKINPSFKELFPGGVKIILIRDSERLSSTQRKAMGLLLKREELQTFRWDELLMNTKRSHQEFLDARSTMRKK
ncbi:MAG: ATP-binding protein [Planctomycetes bacterium]|nr:ATP-binding protein [Planctomycetota bacterium]